jgi:hypothetical protein
VEAEIEQQLLRHFARVGRLLSGRASDSRATIPPNTATSFLPVLRMAGFAEKGPIKSGGTSLAGFAGVRFPQKRGNRTTTPAYVR